MWSTVLAALRFSLYAIIYFNQSHDAQWQLSYLPLWIVDLPISVLYFKFPIPLAEGIVGPSWWFFLPLIAWRVFRRQRLG
jgi:hypothetical protein